MQIQAINSYKPMSATPLKAEAKGIQAQSFKSTPIQSTMGRDLVSFKGFSYKQLPTDGLKELALSNPKLMDFEQNLIQTIANREKVLQGLKGPKGLKSSSSAYYRMQQTNENLLKASMETREGMINDIFAADGLGKIIYLLNEQLDEFIPRKLTTYIGQNTFKSQDAAKLRTKYRRVRENLDAMPYSKELLKQKQDLQNEVVSFLTGKGAEKHLVEINQLMAKLKTALGLQSQYEEALLGIDKAYNKTPFIEKKELLNKEIIRFTEGAGGTNFVQAINKLKAELITKGI